MSTATAEPLTVEGLTVHYGGVCAVRDVGFTVPAGQSVGVIGANGAGKTSALKALHGPGVRARSARSGSATRDLSRVRARDMVRHGIGYVPEGRHVFPGLSVEKNLLLGAYAPSHGTTRPGPRWTRCTSCSRCCGEMRDRLAGALSGGQQQMLAIGRALMSRAAAAAARRAVDGAVAQARRAHPGRAPAA